MKKRIVCFGDSNTWGYIGGRGTRYDENTRWTGLLQKMLGEEYMVIEEGQGGRTIALNSADEGEKSAYDYICPCLESQAPFDLLIIMLGTNDLQVKFGLSAGQISQEMDRLLTKVRGFTEYLMEPPARLKILLVSPIHVGENIENCADSEVLGGRTAVEKSRKLAPLMRAVAEKHDCYFMDASKIAEPGEADQLHMDAEGHQKMADAMFREVKKILA